MNEVKRWGIATHYENTIFRSRLEARWAAFFDLVGWRWTYEPFDGSGYIPDFLIHGLSPLVVEIKPASKYEEYLSALGSMSIPDSTDTKLCLGIDPIFLEKEMEIMAGLCSWSGPTASPADWIRCRKCGSLGIFASEEIDPMLKPCGHSLLEVWGDQTLDQIEKMFPRLSLILKKEWQTAGNRVRWDVASAKGCPGR